MGLIDTTKQIRDAFEAKRAWRILGAGAGAMAGFAFSAQYNNNPLIIAAATATGTIVGAISPAAGIAGGVLGPVMQITGDSGLQEKYNSGFNAGEKDGQQRGNATGYLAGFHAGNETGQNLTMQKVPGWVSENKTAWEQQQLADLETKVLSGDKWNSETVNTTADGLFGNHNLNALSKGQLVQLYGKLSFDAGVYSTPAAQDATGIIKQAIHSDFDVSLDDLSRITDPFAALLTYKSLSSLEGEKKVREQAGTWNATWYEQGKAEILAQVGAWNATNYFNGKTDGANEIRGLADTWNRTWFGNGKEQSLAEVIGVVDDLLSRAQIESASGNITALLNLYKQKISDDMYAAGQQDTRAKAWMTQMTPQYVAGLNASERNDTLKEWARLADLHQGADGWQGWQYAKITPGFDLSGILNDQNITNNTKTYLRSALNGGDSVVLYNLTNNGSDAANGSVAQRYSTQTGKVATSARIISDAEISRIFAYVKGGS